MKRAESEQEDESNTGVYVATGKPSPAKAGAEEHAGAKGNEAGEAADDGETDGQVEAEDGTDNVGDPSVEINVEDLIHELEVQGLANQLGREVITRRRLEELMEQRRARKDLEDFDDYDF